MATFRKITEEVSPDSDQIDDLLTVFRSAREGLLQFSLDLHSAEEDRHFLAHVVLPANQVWVAEADGKIVGFIAFAGGWINHLYVAPAFQRQGVGVKLLAIANLSSDVLRLWVFEVNVPAIEFYQAHGFQIVRRTDGSANEAKMPDVLMEGDYFRLSPKLKSLSRH